MPFPSTEDFEVLAAAQGITLTPERLAQAHGIHEASAEQMARLRALPLSFTEPVSEPATAVAFIAGSDRT